MTGNGASPTPAPPRQDPSERILEVLGAADDPAERPRPQWQRRLNRFCENWIFALIIAFGIRHFGVELFRIPSASMEPMLLGDPGFGKGDFVVVDKLTTRFREVQRWDVAVFQYPVPEVESSLGSRARPALTADGRRLDHPVANPLLGSNFVKRVVVLPGEEFYIQGGDVFLRGQDGRFTIARKPATLQERLWQRIYAAGAQPGYLPWTAAGGSRIAADGDRLDLVLDAAGVRFTQPLRNVYLKEGPVAVRQLGGLDWTKIEGLGMTTPQFTLGGITGTIWQLDRFELKRLTSADEDDPTRRGTPLNELMQEWVGDLRIGFTVAELSGAATVTLASRSPAAVEPERTLDLELRPDGWTLRGSGSASALAASGSGATAGRRFDLAHCDGEVVVRIDGAEAARMAVPWCDPNRHQPGIAFAGTGAIRLAGLVVERDLHYSRKGFLAEAPKQAARPDMAPPERGEQADTQYASQVRLPRTVRAQLLGKAADDLTPREAVAALGTGADNPARSPPGGYLMLGDNSPLSLDGREWGFVPAENLRGRGWLVVFPPQRWRVIR